MGEISFQFCTTVRKISVRGKCKYILTNMLWREGKYPYRKKKTIRVGCDHKFQLAICDFENVGSVDFHKGVNYV
jgi:hypothetical protein